jgi:hypothetical protein
MAEVRDFPVIPIHAVDFPMEGPPCTKVELMQALFALANNNSRFRLGKADQVGFTVEEVERVTDPDEQVPIESIDYQFRATRIRDPGRKASVDFVFGLTGTMENVPLPPYIIDPVFAAMAAEDADYTDTLPERDEEGVMLEPLSEYRHEIELVFAISNHDHQLRVAETHSYKDDDGLLIHEVATGVDKKGDLIYSRYDPTLKIMRDIPLQYPTAQYLARSANESITFVDDDPRTEGALTKEDKERNFWEAYQAMDDEVQKGADEEEDRSVRIAYGVLQSIRRALLVQAGVKVDKLPNDRSPKKSQLED